MKDEETPDAFRYAGFNCLTDMDEIHKDARAYALLKTSVCEIMDLEDMEFRATDITPACRTAKEREPARVRHCWLTRKGCRPAELAEFSDGTVLVAALLVAMIGQKDPRPITCIEEPENCLHPAALQRLLRFLQDNAHKWPVLLTTHSPYLLNGVKPEDVIVAVVDDAGVTHFEKPMDRRRIVERLKHGFSSFGDLMVNNFEEVLR
jgi:predicted ATPase